ncbi:MAG TPA: dihydrolipoamide acetyltransferase family protein [Candidatus Dormibacteraeota bacterium]|nr:dihydrolipoamide acetyltransferase family protein [Candidatus Dormibacteraeota bacterium]
MPALGMAQETGKLIRWLKREGELVAKGEPLMEVETDKAAVEIESPASGTLAAVTAAEGDDVIVGQAIAVILAAGESAQDIKHDVKPRSQPSAATAAGAAPAPAPPHAQAAEAQARAISTGRAVASPKARRLAAEHGVDLSKLQGSGPGGAILEEDVLQAVSGAAADEPALWRAMANNVTRSWKDAPHFFVMREVDASALVEQRRGHGDEVTFTDLLVKAVAVALSHHPRMNGSQADVNIGLAVALPDGLIVPVIHGADRLSVEELAARRRDLLDRVRSGHLRSSDISGGTFTLSNLGMYGVDLFTAILTEGQAGILAVGRIKEAVVVHEGAPAVRPVMQMSLSCDHRKIDGARAAEFVQELAGLLEMAPQA